MLAVRGEQVPDGPEWWHEVKWDGMRVLVRIDAGGVRITSRLGNDVTVAYPELQPLAGLVSGEAPTALLLDGEVVCLVDGRPSFAALAERIHVNRPSRAAELARQRPVSFMIFDLLRVDDHDLTGETLSVRRELLEGLVTDAERWQVSPTYPDGQVLRDATREQGLEGIVSKRLDSTYQAGVRSPAWLKFPHRATSSWVVGGWRPQTGSASALGAVLVGEPTPAGLRYRGRVGSGIGARLGEVLLEVLTPLEVGDSPFCDEVPALDASGARWVEPFLVVDVEALELSPLGRLRQPSLRGVRPDLTPDDLE